MGGSFNDDERDVPQCDAEAGIVPCDMVDFSDVTTARQFHLKVEKLYHDYLTKHCNDVSSSNEKSKLFLNRNSEFISKRFSSVCDTHCSVMMVQNPTTKATLPLHHHQSTSQNPLSTLKQPRKQPLSTPKQPRKQPSTPPQQLSTPLRKTRRIRTRIRTKKDNLIQSEQINRFLNVDPSSATFKLQLSRSVCRRSVCRFCENWSKNILLIFF